MSVQLPLPPPAPSEFLAAAACAFRVASHQPRRSTIRMPLFDASGDLRCVVDFLRQQVPAARAVYLFGTAATGALRPDSDIDLAIECEQPIRPDFNFDCAQQCAKIMAREVDLVDLRRAPLPLQVQILAAGRRLFVANPIGQAFFENSVFSRYCAFNEERRPLLAAVLQRGSVYA